MNWYERGLPNPPIDFSKPIMAVDKDGEHVYLLMPRTRDESYATSAYDWFDVRNGKWNSMRFWKNPQEAVDAYSGNSSRTASNCEITLTPIT